MAPPLVVTGRRVVIDGEVRPATIGVDGGRIVTVDVSGEPPNGSAGAVIDAGDLVVLPGLVDSHVHVNEPGRTDWEGFRTATRAAAAGGTTTIVDMPLNSIPPTVTPEALATKRRAVVGQAAVDVAFWAGLVPGHADQLEPMTRAGVCGFKAFMIDSGVEEFPATDVELLKQALPELARLGRPLLVHAEVEGPMAEAGADFEATNPLDRRRYGAYLASRPHQGEDEAVRIITELAAAEAAAVHIVHLASGPAVDLIAEARRDGVRVTAETCPHYLTLTDQDVPDGATVFKCCPPIRDASHREQLWAGLASGVIDMVVSDHSPAPPDLKAVETGDFGRCWGGISSLQLRLPLIWTEAARRGVGVERLADWLAAAPARLAGIADRKGLIAVGFDADLVVFDDTARATVDPTRLEHRHPLTPYAGRPVLGEVVTTVLRGQVVYRDGAVVGPPAGRLVERAAT